MPEFACDRCGTFLDSVDGAPAICRCDGAFHMPVVEVVESPEPLFAESPPMAEAPSEPEKPKPRRRPRARKRSGN